MNGKSRNPHKESVKGAVGQKEIADMLNGWLPYLSEGFCVCCTDLLKTRIENLASSSESAHVAGPFGLVLGILYRNGRTFATRNKDKTCCIWDTQNLSKSVFNFKGNLGAIRSIRFTSDGQFMAMATPADFVQVYDTSNGYDKEQEIDFFSEISVVYFSTGSLYSLGFGTEHMVAASSMV